MAKLPAPTTIHSIILFLNYWSVGYDFLLLTVGGSDVCRIPCSSTREPIVKSKCDKNTLQVEAKALSAEAEIRDRSSPISRALHFPEVLPTAFLADSICWESHVVLKRKYCGKSLHAKTIAYHCHYFWHSDWTSKWGSVAILKKKAKHQRQLRK